jgi:hypothetical protein
MKKGAFPVGNIDDVIRQMQQDELEDQAEHVTKMTPRDYARARRITPQLIYYYLRTNKLKQAYCECGRLVVDIAEADALFAAIEDKRRKKESGLGTLARSDVDPQDVKRPLHGR